MSLLSYNELCELVERGVITDVDLKNVNGTSIDVHLGSTIMVESACTGLIVSLRDKEALKMERLDITGGSYFLQPNQFILAHTVEKFYMPADISAEFKLNSSGARIGLDNALATWCDPWWHNSTLTLELKNQTQFHTICLHDGARIGQMIFHRSAPIPISHSYAVRGRYNNNASVQGVL